MDSKKHKEIAEYFLTVICSGNKADYSRWDDVVHPNYSPGEIPVKMTQNVNIGKDEFRKRIKYINDGIPDLKYVIRSMITENDEVIVHHDVFATNQGGVWSFPPSNTQAKFLGFHRLKFKDNKIIKVWLVFDTFKAFSDWGQALIKKNDKKEIEKYMQDLRERGILPKIN
ncbi:MAG: ester cyclase [Candidatus Heimdallarchaeota archaeon]|nr:ester cyclase [Candidatus Heimdallarchaeota archaeon]